MQNTMSDWIRKITRWLNSLRPPPSREAEIVEELCQHVEERYRDLLAAGEDEATAARSVLNEIQRDQPSVGGLHDERRITWRIWQSVRYGAPALATLATLTIVLALGLMYWRIRNTSRQVNTSANT